MSNKYFFERKTVWNDTTGGYSPGRRRSGKFGGLRYNRVRYFTTMRIDAKLKKMRIRIGCRTGGRCTNKPNIFAWTYANNIDAKNRLCRPNFFELKAATPGGKPFSDQASILVHEIAHNAGAIYDHKDSVDGSIVGEWGRKWPGLASYNAASYEFCAKDCFRQAKCVSP